MLIIYFAGPMSSFFSIVVYNNVYVRHFITLRSCYPATWPSELDTLQGKGGHQSDMERTNAAGIQGLHHLALKVDDPEVASHFYVRGLGLRETRRWGSGAGRRVLVEVGQGSYLELSPRGPSDPAEDGLLQHFALRVADCGKATDAAIAAGARATVPPTAVSLPTDPPVRLCISMLRPPGGELLELYEVVEGSI